MSEENLPQQISESTLELCGQQIRVANLDNGQRVILKEDFEKLMDFLEEHQCLQQQN